MDLKKNEPSGVELTNTSLLNLQFHCGGCLSSSRAILGEQPPHGCQELCVQGHYFLIKDL